MNTDPDERKMFYNAGVDVFKKASWLRGKETEAEKKLWSRLNKSQLHGFRFKRQHPIAYYIADFYCHQAKLIIEIDGDSHKKRDQKLHDKIRTDELETLGLTVLRFTNEEVLTNVEEVVKRIVNYLPLDNNGQFVIRRKI